MKRLYPSLVLMLSASLLAGAASSVSAAAVSDDLTAAVERARAEGGRDEGVNSYRIGPQNVVQIKIYGDASTHQIYRVDEQGYIKHALVGRIQLSGHTVEQAEKLMETALSGDYIINPNVTIFVLEYSTFSIIGEVRRPGNYEITGRVSIIEAISMAGGFTQVANQRGVKVIRKKEGTEASIEVDTTRITQRGDTTAQVYLEADDVVVVPKSFF